MNIEQINEWVERRLKPGGKWDTDVLTCVFHAMEDTGPCYGNWKHNPTISWSYVRLIEIGCEYLRDSQNVAKLAIFLEHVLGYGISYLKDSQKQRFAEQLAWLLNTPAFQTKVEEAVVSLDALSPDSNHVCGTWLEARSEYKRRHP